MRKIEFLALSAAAVLALSVTASCQKEIEQAPVSSSDTFTVTFSMDEMVTRTAMGEKDAAGNITNVWSDDDDDRMTFYQNDIAAENVEIEIKDDNHRFASFEATFADAAAESYTYKALLAKNMEGGLPVVPAVQHPTASSFDPDANVLVGLESESYSAKQSSVNLVYNHAAAISRISFSEIPDGLKISKVQINASTPIAGVAKSVNYTTGDVDYSTASEKTISLIYNEAPSYSGGTFDAYFVAIPGTATITDIKLVTDKGTFVKTGSNGGVTTEFKVVNFKTLKVENPNIVRTYTKVTTAPNDWSDTYLIVDESSKNIFAYDQTGYKKSVTIENNQIVSSELGNYEVTISLAGDGETDHYLLKTSNGKYLYRSSSNSGDFLNDSFTYGGNDYYAKISGNGNVSLGTKNAKSTTTYYFRFSSSAFGFSTTNKTIQLYKLEDSRTPQTLKFDDESPDVDINDEQSYQQTVKGAQTTVTYAITSASPSDAATIDASTGVLTLAKKGTVEVTATAVGTDQYRPAEASYTLTVKDRTIVEKTYTKVESISEGKYLICGSENTGTYICLFPPVDASKNFDSSNMCNHYQFSTSNNITEITTDNASIIGSEVTITKSGNNWLVQYNDQYMYYNNGKIDFTSTSSSAAQTIGRFDSGKTSMKQGNQLFYHSGTNEGFGYKNRSDVSNLMFFKLDSSE